MVGVEQHLPLEQDAGDPEQPVGDTAQGDRRVAARPEGGVAACGMGSFSTATRAQWNTALRNRTWAA